MSRQITLEQLSSDTRQLYDVLNEESDLACITIAGSFLEAALTGLLRSILKKGSISDRLLDHRGGALGTYAARSDLVYGLGQITKSTYQDLCKLGELRNRVAHSHLRLDFYDMELQRLCDELQQWMFISTDTEQAEEPPPTAEQRRITARKVQAYCNHGR